LLCRKFSLLVLRQVWHFLSPCATQAEFVFRCLTNSFTHSWYTWNVLHSSWYAWHVFGDSF
jgi:hypothetical protein